MQFFQLAHLCMSLVLIHSWVSLRFGVFAAVVAARSDEHDLMLRGMIRDVGWLTLT